MSKKETTVKSVIPMSRMKLKCTFIGSTLGTKPLNPDVKKDFISAKAFDLATMNAEVAAAHKLLKEWVDKMKEHSDKSEDEIKAELIASGITVFSRTKEGYPYINSYMVKGFFKESSDDLRKNCAAKKGHALNPDLKGIKNNMTKYCHVFANDDMTGKTLLVKDPEGNTVESISSELQRPLRADTMQGPRVTLAMSEEIPCTTSIEFNVFYMPPITKQILLETLNLGMFKGIGQWRNSGEHGNFIYEIIEEEEDYAFEPEKVRQAIVEALASDRNRPMAIYKGETTLDAALTARREKAETAADQIV